MVHWNIGTSKRRWIKNNIFKGGT